MGDNSTYEVLHESTDDIGPLAKRVASLMLKVTQVYNVSVTEFIDTTSGNCDLQSWWKAVFEKLATETLQRMEKNPLAPGLEWMHNAMIEELTLRNCDVC